MTSDRHFRRFRRMRERGALRNMVRETELRSGDFIYPLFVTYGTGVRREVPSMPGVFQLSVDQLAGEAKELLELGIGSVILFGIPEAKDPRGTGAYDHDGIVQRAIREFKRVAPDLVVIGDVCLCEYTDHGHCGVLEGERILNDETIELLARTAVAQADAGVDIVAPSDMMDGRVLRIREALDGAGFENIPIVSYAAKYASAFYGPFRDAAESVPEFGDRRSHQMDPGNVREAMREIEADIEEGADAIMVKPALAYLDVIARARSRFDVPIFAYNVSGEYSLIKAAAQAGWIDERRITLETLTAIKRAGADQIVTYHARQAAAWLREEGTAARIAMPVGD
ncbi:MAG: porphobilinogen synthase [Chloroflexota bacterium]